MNPFRTTATGLVWFGFSVAFPGLLQAQDWEIEEEMTVSRTVVNVRVVDNFGAPIPGLSKENFLLKIEGKEVPIIQVEYVDLNEVVPEILPEEDPEADFEFIDEMGPRPGEPGYGKEKLNVVLIQGSINPERQYGLMRSHHFAKKVVSSLPPDSYTAVFSFHTHLQFKCDFTRDKELLHDAVWEAVERDSEVVFQAANHPSVTAHFSEARGKEVANVEDAFLEIARVLRNFNGFKNLVYVGWGIGEWSPTTGMHYGVEYHRAVVELTRAKVSVFSLDLTMADYHSLAAGMMKLSGQTGGTYFSLYKFPDRAAKMVSRSMSAYYLITYEHPEVRKRRPKYKLYLVNTRGSMMVRDPYNRD